MPLLYGRSAASWLAGRLLEAAWLLGGFSHLNSGSPKADGKLQSIIQDDKASRGYCIFLFCLIRSIVLGNRLCQLFQGSSEITSLGYGTRPKSSWLRNIAANVRESMLAKFEVVPSLFRSSRKTGYLQTLKSFHALATYSRCRHCALKSLEFSCDGFQLDWSTERVRWQPRLLLVLEGSSSPDPSSSLALAVK